jgi:hypothetical protein
VNDRYGLPLTAASQAACDAYVAAADRLLGARDGLIAGFEAALALDPEFALAEIGRARCLATYGLGAEARAAAARARALAARGNPREQGHVAALALAVEGRGAEALDAIKTHLREFPRDALVLQPATGIFGLIGFSGRMEREAELLALLDSLAPHYGEDWWFNSIRAFAECEGGRLGDAEARVAKAMEAEPRNANAAHVQAHVLYEKREAEAGARFLRGWLAANPPDVLLRGHLSWHLALLELGLGNADAAWRLYGAEFGAPLHGAGPPTPPINILTDAASWLWRAELALEPVRAPEWSALAGLCAERFPKAGIPFADLHVALVHVRQGDRGALQRLAGELRAGGPAAQATAEFALGIEAFAEGDWTTAARRLEAKLDEAVRVGGSRAQRDLLVATLLAVFRSSGDDERTAALERKRPHVPSASRNRPRANGADSTSSSF